MLRQSLCQCKASGLPNSGFRGQASGSTPFILRDRSLTGCVEEQGILSEVNSSCSQPLHLQCQCMHLHRNLPSAMRQTYSIWLSVQKNIGTRTKWDETLNAMHLCQKILFLKWRGISWFLKTRNWNRCDISNSVQHHFWWFFNLSCNRNQN